MKIKINVRDEMKENNIQTVERGRRKIIVPRVVPENICNSVCNDPYKRNTPINN